MLRLIVLIAVAILLLMAGVASARERGDRPGPMARQMAGRPLPRQMAPPLRQDVPRQPEPQAANHGATGGAEAGHPDASATSPQQRAGRLTPDERKALRRQIDEARDFYRPFPQRRP